MIFDFSENTLIDTHLDLLQNFKSEGVNAIPHSRTINLTISKITFDYVLDAKSIDQILTDRGIETLASAEALQNQAKVQENSNKREPQKRRISLRFEHCDFQKSFTLIKHPEFEIDLEFETCRFAKLVLDDSKIWSKIRIRSSGFKSVSFNNTTFNDLIDFWNCAFEEKVIFYKTDFLYTAVFAACTFKKNVLYTYALIDKLIIFRHSKFEKGLDLSLAIGEGSINCFGLDLNDYPIVTIEEADRQNHELIHDKYVAKEGGIPIQNKRETFRVLKNVFLSQNNLPESLHFKFLEYQTLRRELSSRAFRNREPEEDKNAYCKEKRKFKLKNWFDLRMLELNDFSNAYGTHYGKSLRFILLISIPLFYISAIFSPMFNFSGLSTSALLMGVGYFFQFLNPAHKIEYLGQLDDLKPLHHALFLSFDFLGRIAVGYGIYQTVQAFRKFK